jgi:hypothetical protein
VLAAVSSGMLPGVFASSVPFPSMSAAASPAAAAVASVIRRAESVSELMMAATRAHVLAAPSGAPAAEGGAPRAEFGIPPARRRSGASLYARTSGESGAESISMSPIHGRSRREVRRRVRRLIARFGCSYRVARSLQCRPCCSCRTRVAAEARAAGAMRLETAVPRTRP